MDGVREFYEKQYAWADWSCRWADPPSDDASIRLAQGVRSGSLVAICGDFYEVDVPGPFDVVAYFDGFGIGSDPDQRRLLQRISSWLTPDGCALIDVFAPMMYLARLDNDDVRRSRA